MVFCNNCGKNVSGTEDGGRIWCGVCGKVLVYDIYSEEPTFFKDAAGQSKLSGNFVRGFQSEVSASRERLIENARYELRSLRNGLDMGENEEITDIALRFYTMALERNFTKGRNTERVLAACLYIACRAKRKPYLLIEFSNLLKIDVYSLGGVFMQLCKVLYLDEFPLANKPVDPSIFIAKFSDSLLGGRDKGVIQTAVRIITSMKRNWMQTGRKPSGLCGAALYISALSHGLKCSKSDFLRIAHVCDATLTKRLIEFENTESGSLTFEREVNCSRASENGRIQSMGPKSVVNTAVHAGAEACDESDNLSDIDDVEVDEYLLDEEGKRDKKIIWEALNREYIEEQAAKAAMGTECPESQAAASKKRKERQLAQAAEERNSTPAQTAAEAAYKTLTKKRLSSKINFDVLEDMFETSETAYVSKKTRIDSQSDNDDEMPYMENQELENNDDFGPETEYEEGIEGTYNNSFDFDNVHDAYDGEDYGYEDC